MNIYYLKYSIFRKYILNLGISHVCIGNSNHISYKQQQYFLNRVLVQILRKRILRKLKRILPCIFQQIGFNSKFLNPNYDNNISIGDI